jgi:hypothetical protein
MVVFETKLIDGMLQLWHSQYYCGVNSLALFFGKVFFFDMMTFSKFRGQKMKFGFKILFTVIYVIAISCSDPVRDNVNDPVSSAFSVSVGVFPPSESKVSGDNSIIARFSDSMETSSVKFDGDIDLTNASIEWSRTTFDNDTMTITPQKKIFDNGSGKTFYVSGTTMYGPALKKTAVSYDVDYSVTVSSVTPSPDSAISGYEPIIIVFNTSMDRSAVEKGISGDLNLDRVCFIWSTSVKSDDTLTICVKDPANPLAFWAEGSEKKLSIQGNSLFGPTLTAITLGYTVENRVYVRADDGSDTENIGTSRSPVKTIRRGIDLAQTVYGGSAAKVLVAEGSYQANYKDFGPVVTMADGISLYGGYLKTKWERSVLDSATHRYASESVIENTCLSGEGSSASAPTCAVFIPASVGSATTIDGFTIIAGHGSGNNYYHTAVYCEGVPVIKDNYISGREIRDVPGEYCYGIYAVQNTISLSPLVILNNMINAGAALTRSYGVYSVTANVELCRNTINGGSGGAKSYGIYLEGAAASIINDNTIESGTGTSGGYCIYIKNQTPVITNNRFLSTENVYGFGIYESNSSSNPKSVSRNVFFFPPMNGAWYFDYGNISVTPKGYISDLNTGISLLSESNTLLYWSNLSNL